MHAYGCGTARVLRKPFCTSPPPKIFRFALLFLLAAARRGVYGPAFRSVATDPGIELGLRENDYVFGDLKVRT